MAWWQNRKEEIPTLATVEAAFQKITVDELKKYVALVGDKTPPLRKAELVALCASFLYGNKLQKLWQSLNEMQQAAVAEVVHGPDTFFYAERFAAKYGQVPPTKQGKDENDYSYGYNSKPTLLAFFLYGNIMPDDLKQRLKPFVKPPKQTRLESVAELPLNVALCWMDYNYQTREKVLVTKEVTTQQRDTESDAAQDLPAVLRLVDAGKVALSEKTLRPSAVVQKAVAAVLRNGDFYDPDEEADKEKYDQTVGYIKAFAWPMILHNGKLAEVSGKKLALSKTGRAALGKPPHETIKALWERWLKNRTFDEMNRVEDIKGQTGKGKAGMTGKEGRRTVIQDALKDCPVNEWVNLSDFSRYMKAANYEFEVTRDPWSLYLCEHGYGNLGDNSSGWNILQERYIAALLFEYAATLGLLDVAYIRPEGVRRDYRDMWGADDLEFLSRYDGLLSFRVNPLGAYCLGLAKTYTPPPVVIRSTLTILPSLKVTVTGASLEPDEEMLLSNYAEKNSERDWHLSVAKAMEAVESSHDINELREFLEARDEQSLPETVESFIRNAQDKTRRLKDKGAAFVIDCGTAEIAEKIAAHPNLKRHCLRAGDTHLVVYETSEKQFRQTLYALGYCWPRK